MKNRKILIGTGIAAISLATVVGVGAASAQQINSSSLVDKIAQRFNLNKDAVQKVFDDNRKEHQSEMEKRYEERLAQAVQEGKLTEEQKSKILAKHKELMAEREKNHEAMEAKPLDFEGKSEEERQKLMEQKRAEMEKKRAEIEAWERQNNIPSGYLLGGRKQSAKGPHGPAGGSLRAHF